MVRIKKILNISVLVSDTVTFMSKKKSSLGISTKMLKKIERHSLAVFGSLCGEIFFFNIYALLQV